MAARGAIGLDIGTSGVRAAELSFGRDGVTLERFGQVALPDGAVREGEVVDADVVAQALGQLWSRTRFSTKRVVLGVANQRVVVRQVQLPWMPLPELRRSLPLQAQDFLPMPVEQAVLDLHPLEDHVEGGTRTLRGLLVAADRDMVMANVRAVQRAGLAPTVVDLTPFAVLRSVGRAGVADASTEALVDVGASVTNIVVHSGGVPRFVRILLMGGQDVTDSVADNLGVAVSAAEALKQELGTPLADSPEHFDAGRAVEATAAAFVDEVRGSLDYFAASSPSGPVERVVVTGGGSRLHGLPDRLAAATRVSVEVGDPIAAVRVGRTGLTDDQVRFVRPLTAVPVGLALGAA